MQSRFRLRIARQVERQPDRGALWVGPQHTMAAQGLEQGLEDLTIDNRRQGGEQVVRHPRYSGRQIPKASCAGGAGCEWRATSSTTWPEN